MDDSTLDLRKCTKGDDMLPHLQHADLCYFQTSMDARSEGQTDYMQKMLGTKITKTWARLRRAHLCCSPNPNG